MNIRSDFYSGNIRCLSCENADNVRLEIVKDNNADSFQWFYFMVENAANNRCQFIIENAGLSSYAEGFSNCQVVASYDQQHWFRVPTTFENGKLIIQHLIESDVIYFSYFAPYLMERHNDFISSLKESDLVGYDEITRTSDNNTVELITCGNGKKSAWIIARQHPGESMAQWWIEGFVERLIDNDDAVSRFLLGQFTFYIVPNMNPDGSARGNLRTNASGIDLNRAWLNPCIESSAEVYWVREKMHDTGVSFCMDVHGDECLPYNFIAGANNIPSWNNRKAEQLNRYRDFLAKINPDFQTEFGYPPAIEADLALCNNYVAEQFDCLAMTFEMPFKDADNFPLAKTGWSPSRCKKMGASNLDAMLFISQFLE